MKISETLQKSSPLIPKREMSKTEYMKLVDANTELVDKMNDLQKRIDKAVEYIEKYLQEHIIDEYPDEQSTFYDEKDRFIPNAKEQLLNILQGSDKE